jgi:hypothetical protein
VYGNRPTFGKIPKLKQLLDHDHTRDLDSAPVWIAVIHRWRSAWRHQ